MIFNYFDIKLWIGIVATVLTIGANVPYYRDIFKKKTTPHMYTWLIWAITQTTATLGILYGGGKFGAIGWVVGTCFVIGVFVLSLKFGTKNIKRIDLIALITALLAVIVWWQLHSPVLAVIMVSVIDGLGYIPTWRKSYEEPWSETLSFWALVVIAAGLTICANAEYNILTMLYPTVLLVSNAIVWIICIIRRKHVVAPQPLIS